MLGAVTTAKVVVCSNCGEVLGIEHHYMSNHHRDNRCSMKYDTEGQERQPRVAFVLVVVPLPSF